MFLSWVQPPAKRLRSRCFPRDAPGAWTGSCASILIPLGRARAGGAVLVVGQGFGHSPAQGAAVSAVHVQVHNGAKGTAASHGCGVKSSSILQCGTGESRFQRDLSKEQVQHSQCGITSPFRMCQHQCPLQDRAPGQGWSCHPSLCRPVKCVAVVILHFPMSRCYLRLPKRC